MKISISFVLLFSFIFIFSNCKKEPPTPPEPMFRVIGSYGLYKPTINSHGCATGGFFCERRVEEVELIDFEDASLEAGEILGTANVSSINNEDVIDFNFSRTNLSQETVNNLVVEKKIELDSFEFSPNLVKEIYDRANMEYIPYNIEAGVYDIELKDSNGVAPTPDNIKIDIKLINTGGVVNVKTIISY